MKKRMIAKLLAVAAVLLACLGGLAPFSAYADDAAAEYKLYPTPHSMVYGNGAQTLRNKASVLTESGIDADTISRLDEALALKGIKAKSVDAIPSKSTVTTVLVGVKGSGGAVDTYVDQLVQDGKLSYTDGLFDHNDSYVLASLPSDGNEPDRVIVLGKTTDAAYYGLTTLYQILQQTPDAKLRTFTMSDYADVVTRGFIEGYYGNPWSTEDRVNLMQWGGYYKLNAYVYAPKDDPKHNAKWRELYTEEELTEKIEPLAEAGNTSKCRFVFALHPFMYNPITNSNYDESVAILKEKFTQVMDHGVRQISILADDAGNQGSALYTRLCNDMTDWLHEKQTEKNADGSLKYPGLKDTLIFCPVNYMGWGESWYANLPKTVQVINTGGRVWGKVDNNFTSSFTNNSGVAPFMWINWPCTDNSKNTLSMGGYENALGTDVQPGKVQGVVLNPMQQSEPSKAAIFMNADFSWNLWKSQEHADQAWEDSFSYVDHNSPTATKGSDALRELSRHMKRYTGGGVVFESRESANIKSELQAFQGKIASGSVTAQDCDDMIALFGDLQKAAKTYRSNAGNKAMLGQIVYWIDTWDDVTRGAIAELQALKADLAGDSSKMLSKYSEGSDALAASRKHGFHYVDHTEYATVGNAYIMPMINALDGYLAQRATLAANPNADTTQFVTSRTDTPEGKTENVFDGKANTGVVYKNPNKLTAGTYFGMIKSKPFNLTNVTFIQGNGADYMQHAKLQTYDGENWNDVEGQGDLTGTTVTITGLDIKGVYGVRLIATQDNNRDAWPTIYEIQVNKEEQTPEGQPVAGAVTIDGQVLAAQSLSNINDGNVSTYAHLQYKKANAGDPEYNIRDTTQPNATVTLTFTKTSEVDTFTFVQAARNGNEPTSGDGINAGVLEYQNEAGTWIKAGDIDGTATQTITLPSAVNAKAIRVKNTAATKSWWKVYELSATKGATSATEPTATVTSTGLDVYQSYALSRVVDGNEDTYAWVKHNSGGGNIKSGDTITVTYSAPKTVGHVRYVQGNDNLSAGALEYTGDGVNWVKCGDITSSREQEFDFENVQIRGIRVRATEDTAKWWKVCEIATSKGKEASTGTIRSDISGVSLKATGEDGGVQLSDGTVSFGADNYLAVDLGAVRNDVSINTDDMTLPEDAKVVYSQNALEWLDYASAKKPVQARFVGIKASAACDVAFTNFSASYKTVKAPSYVKGDLGNFDASKIFDGDLSTTFKNTQGATEGSTIVFDLGQERTINSVAYYVPETTYDFIRKGVIEVADSPDAADNEWTEVLKINSDSATIDNSFNSDTAKTAAWLTHDTKNPGNMCTANPKTDVTATNDSDPNGTEKLNVTGRYMRIRFTATYTQRWIEIGEIRINGGEYVSTYGDADFDSSSTEVEGKTPANLADGDTKTAWQPQDNKGTLVYHVSEPIAEGGKVYSGVRIVSAGTPSNAKVSATVYTDAAYSTTTEVELGTLNQPVSEFCFGTLTRAAGSTFSAVKDITITWDGAAPQIAEFFLIDDANPADTTALQAAIDELDGKDVSGWTKSTADAFNKALATAKETLANTKATQTTVDSVTAALRSANAAGVEKYTGEALPKKISNDDGQYTVVSYQAYADAYAEAEQAFANPDELAKSEGEALLAALKAKKDALAYDQSALQRAKVALADAKLLYGEADAAADKYTTDSAAAYRDAMNTLEQLVANAEATPKALKAAQDALEDAEGKLVDASELRAARAEYEKTNGKLYTDESFNAYMAAYDESDAALKNGTAEQVAAATAKLNDAKAALVLRPAVDLNKVIAEAEKLDKADYTEASWAPFAAAIEAAKAPHDSANDADLAQAITDAKAALINVKALKADIASAKKAQAKDYTEDSMDQLNAALTEAEAVLKDGSVDEVAAARTKIADALKALVNVSALKDAIVKAENLDTANGTDEQKAQLADAIAAAKALLKSGSADEVAAALESLNAAMGVFGGSGSVKPEQPGTGGGNQQGGSGQNKPGKPSNGSSLPGTGDVSLIAPMVLAGLGAAALYCSRRR